jgi:ribulose-5-phosphate 4-epimerase/fuculose-1-phosphate aldolase
VLDTPEGSPYTSVMGSLSDLVAANRILAHEGVLDAFGHVSIRHPANPGRYLLSRSRSPELVEADDIMEFALDGTPIDDDRTPYNERFIHGAIYEQRPEIHAVVHSHAEAVLPFTIVQTPLVPVIHVASCIGEHVPVWDIRDRFGDTNLQVKTMEQGRDLARALSASGDRVALMRGHGFAAAGRSLLEVVRIAVYLPQNARVFTEASRMGSVTPLSAGEIRIRASGPIDPPEYQRAWEYWLRRAGVSSPDDRQP